MKLFTTVQSGNIGIKLNPGENTMLLGSCFSDEFFPLFSGAGFRVCRNPFGTVYNPLSIESAISRLRSEQSFTQEDCIEIGGGSGKICSFSHHTSFARDSKEDFLEYANAKLKEASSHWKESDAVIITLGTAWVWKKEGKVVSNCLKRPGTEFTQELMSVCEVKDCINRISEMCTGKKLLFTVSPIRHRGAHDNALGKSALLLGLHEAGVCYFPAYEILMDELRDYRFYAQDLVHPSQLAVEIIWERLLDAIISKENRPAIEESLSASRKNAHIPILF